MKTVTLLNAVIVTGVGSNFTPVIGANRAFQAIVSGTGAVTATVNVEVSLDGVNFLIQSTIILSGTTSATDGFASFAQWQYVRGNVTAISGTGAAVTLYMSV
jgi:hypothetical protein